MVGETDEANISASLQEENPGRLEEHYVLRLYITGATTRSTRAIQNIKRLCEEHLAGRYDLEIIDLYGHPEQAREEQLLVAPTLIKKLPMPLRRLIGDLSDTGKVLIGLDVVPEE